MQDSLFTKIIKGDIPCHKVYEDEDTFAFLDIYPVQPGHTLVVPKNQVEFVWDLEEADYLALMITTQKVALRLREVLSKTYVGERVVGTDVPHAHVHLIPFNTGPELYARPNEDEAPNHSSLSMIAKKLAF